MNEQKTDKELAKAAKEAQREYNQKYYLENKKRLDEKNKKWRKDNPEKVAAANRRYWINKAAKKQA